MRKGYRHDENEEKEGLQLLINRFGCNRSDINIDNLVKTISARYKTLTSRSSIILSDNKQNAAEYYEFCLKAHQYLYKDILNNAGCFRRSSDPNNGFVYFGGNRPTTGKDRFLGTEPQLIQSELRTAFSILFDNSFGARENAIRFYAEFVAVHPFYDANGRIARCIVDAFLKSNHIYVDWISLNKRHGKFLRKMNYCHSVRAKGKQKLLREQGSRYYDREQKRWSDIRNKYIGFLYNFWQTFLSEIPIE